jgi:hypothetical protein
MRRFKADFLDQEMARHGVFRTTVLRPKDTMIVGFPKSGHTWMQSLIANVKYGVDPRIADDHLIQDLVPDLHQRRWHKRYGKSMCFKSHMLPRKDFKRVIYLIRDGRDVMVSYYHFRRAWGYNGSLVDLITEEHPLYATWSHHVATWLDNPYGAHILYVRYENMLNDSVGTLRQICDFLSLETSEEELEAAAFRSSFQNMRAKEDKFGRPNKDWPADRKFMRRGIAGSWKDEMPPDVEKAFLTVAGPTMQRIEGL